MIELEVRPQVDVLVVWSKVIALYTTMTGRHLANSAMLFHIGPPHHHGSSNSFSCPVWFDLVPREANGKAHHCWK